MASAVSSSLASVEAARAFGPPGHDELHGARIGIESRWNLGGVESAEAPAGSCADVDEASTLAESGDDDVDGAGDLRQGASRPRRPRWQSSWLIRRAISSDDMRSRSVAAGRFCSVGKLAKVGVCFLFSFCYSLRVRRQVVRLSESAEADHSTKSRRIRARFLAPPEERLRSE